LVLEGWGGHGLEGKIFTTSIGQKEQVQRGVMKSLGEKMFGGLLLVLFFLGKGGEG
jgi:hypothetical protein